MKLILSKSNPFYFAVVHLIMAAAFVGAADAGAFGMTGNGGHFGTMAELGAKGAIIASVDDKTTGSRVRNHSPEFPAPVDAPEVRNQIAEAEAYQTEREAISEAVPVIRGEDAKPVKDEHAELSYSTGLTRGFVTILVFGIIFTILLTPSKCNP